jgi:hypothetical protein
MQLGKSWFTIEEAISKYSLKTPMILNWVEQGVVRTQQTDTRLMRVNSDDIKHKMLEVTEI